MFNICDVEAVCAVHLTIAGRFNVKISLVSRNFY